MIWSETCRHLKIAGRWGLAMISQALQCARYGSCNASDAANPFVPQTEESRAQ